MTKTPEDLAKQKVNEIRQSYARRGYDILAHTVRIANEAYLAGFEAAKPKWISVEERLPELYTRVLIKDDLDTSERIVIAKYCENEADHTFFWRMPIYTRTVRTDDCWMPLPELPEEKPQATEEINNVGLGASAIDSGEKNLGITREMEDEYLRNLEEEKK